jgi:hypothetical protein
MAGIPGFIGIFPRKRLFYDLKSGKAVLLY